MLSSLITGTKSSVSSAVTKKMRMIFFPSNFHVKVNYEISTITDFLGPETSLAKDN